MSISEAFEADVAEAFEKNPNWATWEPSEEQRAVGAERLMRLRDILVADANNPKGARFDLDGWAMPAGIGGMSWDELKDHLSGWEPAMNCGTAACAVGLACLSGEFASEKLAFHRDGDSIAPVFGGYRHWSAVKLFFGLNEKEAEHLFQSDSYHVAQGAEAELAVAHRIAVFVREYRNV